MSFSEVENWTQIKNVGMQLWHPEYKELPLKDVIKQSRVETEYLPFGYNTFILDRSTGTIHAFKN